MVPPNSLVPIHCPHGADVLVRGDREQTTNTASESWGLLG